MALMPVHSHGEFLGFIGFDDCRTERIWKGEELELLRAAAAGLLNQPLTAQTAATPVVADLTRRLEDYLRTHTEILMP